MLKNTKIKHKLTLMVIIPIIGLIYFTIDSTLDKLKIVHEMNLLQDLSVITVKSSALIHELQIERGMSAGFIGSQGIEFAEELPEQRMRTHFAIKELKHSVDGFNFENFNKEVKKNLEVIFAQLSGLDARRDWVDDLNVSLEKLLSYYTEIVNALLKEINHLSKIITHAQLSNMVVTYVNLLQAKEKAGIERAILNNAISQGHFTPQKYKEFVLLVGAQDIYVTNFFFFATSTQKKYYQNIMQGPFVDEVAKIRTLVTKSAFKFQLIATLHAYVGYDGLIQQLNDYILWGESKYIDAFYQQYQSVLTILETYKNLPEVSSLERQHLAVIKKTFETYKQYLTRAITLKKQQKSIDEIDELIEIDDAPIVQALHHLLKNGHLGVEATEWWEMATGRINLIKAIEELIAYDLKTAAQTLKQNAQSTFIFYLILTGITILLTLFLSYLFARGITKPLKALVQVANQISAGSRNINVQVNSTDETGQLSCAMKQMLDSIIHSETMLKKEINERKQAEKMLIATNQAYERFVPNELLQLLNKDHIIDIQLGNHLEMNMTILFSDIRCFTTLSERMSPQENFNFINAYLKEMGPVIREHGGFVDKYIGDAIMALFINADDALNASIAMHKKLLEFNNNPENKELIKIGIGLNTGQLMLGIIGEQHRLQGTVISDSVNLASRLEGATKTYKGSLIISENTLSHLKNPDKYAMRFLDNIKVKGRSERIKIFEVFDADPVMIREGKIVTLTTFEEGVRLYQQQKFLEAKKLMQGCLVLTPGDAPAEIYIQRCQNFLKINQSDYWELLGKKVEWTSHFEIGDIVIDAQHRELFVRIKNLIMSIGIGKTEEEVEETINFLESYVITHFHVEEMYMEQYNYQDYALHQEQHLEFLKHVEQLKQDYREKGGNLYLALKIQKNIVQWMTEHIGHSDWELGQFLKDKK
jgi:hemerythrin-like metal-binding protein